MAKMVRACAVVICLATVGCDSPSDVVIPDPPSGLRFRTSPPSTGIAGSPFGVVVEVIDAKGQVVSDATPTITLSLLQTDGTVLHGTTTVTAVQGVATFSGLSVTKGWVGYSVTASAPGLQSATSTSFMFYGSCSQLFFSPEPSAGKAGATLPSLTVRCGDQYGNGPIPPGGTLVVTISLGANPAGAELTGTLTKSGTGSGGVPFSDLVIDKAGVGYTLTATFTGSGSGISAGTSAPFTITPE